MGSLSEECCRYYGAQLLDAIEFMHSRGVLHRDLKPENILLDDKMRIKVTDFGTAKLIGRDRDEQGNELDTYPQDTRASSFVGTAEYVSPELLSDKYVTKSCDLWAYGCIIYQMVAGKPPFKGKNEFQTFQKIVKLQYSFPPSFPVVLRDLIKKILVTNPERRFTSAQIQNHPFFEPQVWSQAAIWKSNHPRLLPYKPQPRSASNPITRMAGKAYGGTSNLSQVSSGPYTSNTAAVRNKAAIAMNQPSATSRVSSSPNLASSNNNNNNNNPNSTGSPYYASNNQSAMSAAAGAAAALAKPVSTISPYHTPTQPHTTPPVPSSNSNNINNNAIISSNNPTNNSSNKPSASTTTIPASNTSRTVARVPVTSVPSYKQRSQQQQPLLSSESNRQITQTTATSHQQQQQQQSTAYSNTPAPKPVKPLELPPISNADRELQSLFVQKDERILKIGSVSMSVTSSNSTVGHPQASLHSEGNNSISGSSNSGGGGIGNGNNHNHNHNNGYNEDDFNNNDKEPSRISRLFAGSRKKKRVMFITTAGRLVVITSTEDKKVHLDIRVVAPQVIVREFAHNRKSNVGVFAVEAHNRVYTFEDSFGSSDWMASIAKAKLYVDNVEAIHATKTHMTAAAAAIAAAASSAMRSGTVGIGGGTGGGSGSGSGGTGAGTGNNNININNGQTAAVLASASASASSGNMVIQGRKSTDMDTIVSGTSSLFLRRHEERKMRKVV